MTQESKLQEVPGIPRHVAACAVMPMGRPVKQRVKLRRKTVRELTVGAIRLPRR